MVETSVKDVGEVSAVDVVEVSPAEVVGVSAADGASAADVVGVSLEQCCRCGWSIFDRYDKSPISSFGRNLSSR